MRVDGVLLGEDSYTSPMTGRRALLLQYGFWDRSPQAGAQFGGDQATHYRRTLLVMDALGGDLRVEVAGATLLVPLSRRVGLDLLGSWDPAPVLQTVPPDFHEANPGIDAHESELCYDELALHPGQTVRVHGVVEPAQRARGGGAFRGGQGADWDYIARPELGPFRIEERRR